MTNQRDVITALENYESAKANKKVERTTKAFQIASQLKKAQQLISRWVYSIQDIRLREIAAESKIVDGDIPPGWGAIELTFADISIKLEPSYRAGRLYHSVNFSGEPGKIELLMHNEDCFAVYDGDDDTFSGELTESDFLKKIIDRINAEKIKLS